MDYIQKAEVLIEKIKECYMVASFAYDVVIDTEIKHSDLLAMQFLNNADINKADAATYYFSNEELERDEFENFFAAYSNFKFEMLEAIKEQSENTSYVMAKLDELEAANKEVVALLDNHRVLREEQKRVSDSYTPENIRNSFK